MAAAIADPRIQSEVRFINMRQDSGTRLGEFLEWSGDAEVSANYFPEDSLSLSAFFFPVALLMACRMAPTVSLSFLLVMAA